MESDSSPPRLTWMNRQRLHQRSLFSASHHPRGVFILRSILCCSDVPKFNCASIFDFGLEGDVLNNDIGLGVEPQTTAAQANVPAKPSFAAL